MVRSLLVRGMLVGVLAGLLVFAFGRFVGEPQVDLAISFETTLDRAKAMADAAKGIHVEAEPVLVSRSVQAGWGLFTGVLVYSAAFGGLFALVFAAVQGRAVNLQPRATSLLLATAGFVSVYLMPSLKYPASPPSVGEPDGPPSGYRIALRNSSRFLEAFSRHHGPGIHAAQTPRTQAWRVDRRPHSRRLLPYCNDSGRKRAARHRRSAGGVSGCGSLALPRCIIRHATRSLDNAWPGFRCSDRARLSEGSR